MMHQTDFEKGIQDADYIKYGQRMRDQAAAMVDFQDTLTSLGSTDVTDAMGAFRTSWESLDTTLRSSSGGLKFFETMKNAITQAQMTGDWSEVKGHAASSSKFLNDTFSKTVILEFG